MDREEARNRLLNYSRFIVEGTDLWEALDLAIEALQEKHQLSGETSTISEETSTNSNKNSKDNLSFSKSVKLINPCSSLLKADSDECKEQKSKLDCISRRQAVEAIEKEIERIRENPCAIATEGDFYYQNALKLAQEIIELQPPVTPTDQTIKEIMDFIGGMNMVDEISNEAYTKISVFVDDGTPTERTGEWIKSEIPNELYVCSECGGACWSYDYERNIVKSNFCPSCGCAMDNKGE